MAGLQPYMGYNMREACVGSAADSAAGRGCQLPRRLASATRLEQVSGHIKSHVAGLVGRCFG